jgi:hypothetical protein
MLRACCGTPDHRVLPRFAPGSPQAAPSLSRLGAETSTMLSLIQKRAWSSLLNTSSVSGRPRLPASARHVAGSSTVRAASTSAAPDRRRVSKVRIVLNGLPYGTTEDELRNALPKSVADVRVGGPRSSLSSTGDAPSPPPAQAAPVDSEALGGEAAAPTRMSRQATFAQVEFGSEQDARQFMDTLHTAPLTLRGRVVRTDFANGQLSPMRHTPSRRIQVGSLPNTATRESIAEALAITLDAVGPVEAKCTPSPPISPLCDSAH